MIRNLSYKQKNKLLWPVAAAGLLICWFFAFNKTAEALSLHSELIKQQPGNEDISFNQLHEERKLDALNKILKSYQVKEADWSNELWMKTSDLAMKEHIGIDYTVTKPLAEKDSTLLGINQVVNCYGNFTQLVKLVDTLEKTNKIGKIMALQITAPKEDAIGEHSGKSLMKIEFKGITDTLRR